MAAQDSKEEFLKSMTSSVSLHIPTTESSSSFWQAGKPRLRLEIVGGRNMGIRVMVEASFDVQTYHTRPISNVDPSWNEVFHYYLSPGYRKLSLKFTAWDLKVEENKRIFAGNCYFPLSMLRNGVTEDRWFYLSSKTEDEELHYGSFRAKITMRHPMGVPHEEEPEEEEITAIKIEEGAAIEERNFNRWISSRKMNEDLILVLERLELIVRAASTEWVFTTTINELRKRAERATVKKDIVGIEQLNHTIKRFSRNVCRTKYAILLVEYEKERRMIEVQACEEYNALCRYFEQQSRIIEAVGKKRLEELDEMQGEAMNDHQKVLEDKLKRWNEEVVFRHLSQRSIDEAVQQAKTTHSVMSANYALNVNSTSIKDRKEEWTLRTKEIYRGREEILSKEQERERSNLDTELVSDMKVFKTERNQAEQELFKLFEIRMFRLQKTIASKMHEADTFMQLFLRERPGELVPPNSFDSVHTIVPMLKKRYNLFSSYEEKSTFLSLSCEPSPLSQAYNKCALDLDFGRSVVGQELRDGSGERAVTPSTNRTWTPLRSTPSSAVGAQVEFKKKGDISAFAQFLSSYRVTQLHSSIQSRMSDGALNMSSPAWEIITRHKRNTKVGALRNNDESMNEEVSVHNLYGEFTSYARELILHPEKLPPALSGVPHVMYELSTKQMRGGVSTNDYSSCPPTPGSGSESPGKRKRVQVSLWQEKLLATREVKTPEMSTIKLREQLKMRADQRKEEYGKKKEEIQRRRKEHEKQESKTSTENVEIYLENQKLPQGKGEKKGRRRGMKVHIPDKL